MCVRISRPPDVGSLAPFGSFLFPCGLPAAIALQMRNILFLVAGIALLAGPVSAQRPPREESPAPRENLESFGSGSTDDELSRAIAARNRKAGHRDICIIKPEDAARIVSRHDQRV